MRSFTSPFRACACLIHSLILSPVLTGSVLLAAVAPMISQQPTSQTIALGSAASFSVSAVGDAPFTYQWKKAGNAINGATAASLSLPSVIAGDAASYTVTVTNASGSITSAPAVLIVGTKHILYVKANATGSNNGSSWANAFTSLNSALTAAVDGDEIWVAAGTYKPSTTGDRNAYFAITKVLTLFGGFAGTETNAIVRNWNTNATILSGDLSGNDTGPGGNQGDNSKRVVVYEGNSNAVLDGFRITGGNAPGSGQPDSGAGVYVGDGRVATIVNCTFYWNYALSYGGGLAAYSFGGLTVADCYFHDNAAPFNGGGGMIAYGFSYQPLPHCIIKKTLFANNSGSASGGLLLYGDLSTYIDNSVFKSNSSGGGLQSGVSAGAIRGFTGSPGRYWITNCTFAGNTNSRGTEGAVSLAPPNDGNSIFANSIVVGSGSNPVAFPLTTYLLSDTSITGTNNVVATPTFTNSASPLGADGLFGTRDDGFILTANSSGVDTGSTVYSPIVDATGTARATGAGPERGAYELSATGILSVWSPVSVTSSPPGALLGMGVAAWTGSEMIVWGGSLSGSGAAEVLSGQGGRYSPSTRAWSALPTSGAPTSRGGHTAVWTGSEYIVWGGYDASTKFNTGGRYNVGANQWTATHTTGAPSARLSHCAVWTGTEMLIWGGLDSSGTPVGDGKRYNPSTGTWTSMSATGAPSARHEATCVWTGSKMIVWGGKSGSTVFSTGGIYDPATDTWTATSTTNAPAAEWRASSIWTGSEMLIFGGFMDTNGGGHFNPTTNVWSAFGATSRPSVRADFPLIWTGEKMIVWGGWAFAGGWKSDGATYDPITKVWAALPSTNAPAARSEHVAVWTGQEMLIWGGGTDGAQPRLTSGGHYGPQLPEITVEQPAGTNLVDDAAIVSFGNVFISSSASLTFSIRNTGTTDLTGLGITVDGTNSADFSITTIPTAPVTGPSGSTTFTVRFAPTSTGSKSATLHIATNDPNEASFDIGLTGTGQNNAPTISSLANSAINEDSTTTALAFTVADVETAAAALTVTGSSSNTTLVPNTNIVFGGSGANRTVTATPAANQNGTATIIVTVSDGLLSATSAFVLTVTAVNDVPVATGASMTGDEDAASITGSVTATDADTGAVLTFIKVSNPAHGTATLNAATGTVSYTPAADYNGPDSFTFKANDGTVDSNTAAITITVISVNDIPVATGTSLTGDEDAATITGNVTASDADTDAVLTFAKVSDPANGTATVNATTGAVSYTPSVNFNGSDSFTVKANDGTADSNSVTVVITVNPINDAPTASNGLVSGDEDMDITGTLSANDIDAATTLTFAKVAGASHGSVSVNAVTGTFSYTPELNYNGPDSFTFKANDGMADSNVATITITVGVINDAPVATDSNAAGDEDSAISGTLVANDVDAGDTLTFAKVADPAHGSVSINSATGAYSYMPNANYHGSDSFTFKVNDTLADSNVATVLIMLNPVNDAPTASALAISGNEDAASITGSVTGSDIEGSPLTFAKVTEPAHGTATVTSAGFITYIPALNYNGSDSFTFNANDGELDSNVATVTITINAVNDAPVAENLTVNGNEDTASIGGTATAADVEGSALTFSKIIGPLHGTLTFNTNGSFSYVPTMNYNGPDSFTFKANDGLLDSVPATVTINVAAVNDAPTATDGSTSGDEDTAITGAASGSDIDGDMLTFARVAGPSHGTLVLATNGAFTYTPATNYNGADSFVFRVNDGTVNSALAVFDLTVNAVNDAPVVSNSTASGDEDAVALTGTLSASDVDAGNTLTYLKVSDPAHGTVTITAASGAFSYVPAANYHGSDSFTFKANDGELDSNTATISISVNAVNDVNDVPVATGASLSGDEDAASITGNVTATDADTDAVLTFTKVTEPAHGTVTINATTGEVSYMPVHDYNGNDSFTLKANDGVEDSNLVTVSLTINAINDAPIAQNGAGSAEEDMPITGTLVANDVDSGTTLSFLKVSEPAHGSVSINASTGAYTYQADKDYNGNDSFTFKANDGLLDSNIATISLTLGVVNDAPVSSSGMGTGDEDQAISGSLVASDADEDILSFIKVSDPAHGSVTINANTGAYVYQPALNYNGSDSFTFKVNDGLADSTAATITLTINAVNDAPVANALSLSGNEDAATITGTATGSDVDGGALSFAIVTNAAHGSATLNPSTGAFSYTPQANYFGIDSVTFTVNDGGLDSAVATISLSISSVNDAPVATDSNTATDEDIALTGVLSGSDIDGDGLTYQVANPGLPPALNNGLTLPSKGYLTLNSATGAFTYHPNQNVTGSDSFTFRVSDGLLNSNIGTVSITITPVNDVPVAQDGNAKGVINDRINGELLASDIETPSLDLVLTLVTPPAHGTVTVAQAVPTTDFSEPHATYVYQPTPGYTGIDSFAFKANDGTADSNVATISLNIDPLVPNWTWRGGSNLTNAKSTVSPGARDEAATWTDGAGRFYVFGGRGYGVTSGPGYLNDLWRFEPTTSAWTRLGGSVEPGASGSYGTTGVAAANNWPGARSAAATWYEPTSNTLWMFGGAGLDGTGAAGELGDLWKYELTSQQWTFVSGADTVDSSGLYFPNAPFNNSNYPGSRDSTVTWRDSKTGLLYLYGGHGRTNLSDINGLLCDHWSYDPQTNLWVWLNDSIAKHSNDLNLTGTYGTQGTASANNNPGARSDAAAWTDKLGRCWLYGGAGYGASGGPGVLADLWVYTPDKQAWTWVSGPNSTNAAGVYGTLGQATTTSHPGSRANPATCVDAAGNLWLAGGYGAAATIAQGHLDDVWRYDTTDQQWAWMKGQTFINKVASYGAVNTATSTNTPGSRRSSAAFVDAMGELWLFGGSNGTKLFSDLWQLDLPAIPVVETLATTAYTSGYNNSLPGPVTRVLNATVNSQGLPITTGFRIATTPSLSQSDGSSFAFIPATAGASPSAFSDLAGLLPGLTYYFQAYATSAAGTGYGTVVCYSTPGTPAQPVISLGDDSSASITEAADRIVNFVGPNGSPNSGTSQPSFFAAQGIAHVYVYLDTPAPADMSLPFSLQASLSGGVHFTAPTSPLLIRAGTMTAEIAIPIINDFAVEPSNVLTLIIQAPSSGATLGSNTTVTLAIDDNDFIPTIATPPQSQFLVAGSSNNYLSVGANSAASTTYQWFKNSKAIAKATSSWLVLPSTTASLGSYNVTITDPVGNVSSSAAEISLITVTDSLVSKAPGSSLTMTATASSPSALSYEWRKGDATTFTVVTASTTKTLALSNLSAADSGDYYCHVSSAAGASHNTGTTSLRVVFFAPEIQPITALDTGLVGQFYEYQVVTDNDVLNAPTSFTASGLPAGLSITNTGLITGRPTMPVTNKPITIIAKNSAGSSVAETCTLTILAMSDSLQGTYLAKVTGGAFDQGARLDITTTGKGDFTVKHTDLGGSVSGKGLLNARIESSGSIAVLHYSGTVVLPIKRFGSLSLTLDILDGSDGITGHYDFIGGGFPSQLGQVIGYRNVWATTPAQAYLGYYTTAIALPEGKVGDQALPQGTGFASFTVASKGTLSFVGSVADDSKFTAASVVGPDGQVLVYAPFVVTQSALVGCPIITASTGDNYASSAFTGSLDWTKRPALPTSKDHTYRQGFVFSSYFAGNIESLVVTGGKYDAPQQGEVVMGLPPVTPDNAVLSFTNGGLVMGDSPDVIFTIANPSSNGIKQVVSLPLAGGARNPAKATFKLLAKPAGQFSGTFTIANPITTLIRNVTFQGIMHRNGSTQQGSGYFLLPQLPQPGETLKTSTILSGQVLLKPAD